MKERIQKLEDYIYGMKNNLKVEIKLENKINKISSIIREEDEFIMIKEAIEKRINKNIKDIKKLYQATIDGGDGIIFHNKCDNILNTLILIESKGNRRFGGFASKYWEKKSSSGIQDKNCFLFSLDKKKIYPPKNNYYYALCNYFDEGPNFSYRGLLCIIVGSNIIKNKELITNESIKYLLDLFNNDKIYGKEYEVFQIIFS